MTQTSTLGAFTSLAVLAVGVMSAQAQPPCTRAPIGLPLPQQPLSLTEQQEVDLGDAVAEHFHQEYPVLEGEANRYLQDMGDRLVRELPATGLKFRFMLMNGADVGAFALPGGRVYVTRKLVALTRSEDELAGVLAHEIGHIITRQIGTDMSRYFRDALGVTTFGDRNDIYAKYRQLVESTRVIRSSRRDHDRDQFQADRVGMLTAARAGYSPASYVELWDRYSETESKTGNLLTDFFGTTRPESRRLREMLRTIAVMPKECRTPAQESASDAFRMWRESVIEGDREQSKAPLRAIVHERALDPPLREDITHLKFSPDGRYVLAQDHSSVYVLTRDPFAVLFRLDADDAERAQFTPDSTRVVFHTRDLRVEWWDIGARKRSGAFELVARDGCLQTSLSPNGKVLGCVDPLFRVLLIDVESGARLFEKKQTFLLDDVETFWMDLAQRSETLIIDVLQMGFSPDSRYFAAGSKYSDLVVDLETKQEADLPGAVRKAFRRPFAFLGSDRLVTVDSGSPDKSAILTFPSGERLKSVTLAGKVSAAARGEYVILRPVKDWPVGLVDLNADKIVFASRSVGFDVHDGVQLAERLNGEIAMYPVGSAQPLAVATLPQSRLGRLAAAAVSRDLKWVALAGSGRGGVWNLQTGRRTAHVRRFNGAYLAEDGTLYVDFPKHTQVQDGARIEHERAIARLDPSGGPTTTVPVDVDEGVMQRNRALLVMKAGKDRRLRFDSTMQARDVTDGRVRWERHFPDEPPRWYTDLSTNRLIFEWPLWSRAARQEVKKESRLKQMAEAGRLQDEDVYLEVLDLLDGKRVGQLVVSTGNGERRILHAVTSGDTIVVSHRGNHVSTYSLATGTRRGGAFGQFAIVSDAARLVAIQNREGRLQFFDVDSMKMRDEIPLPGGIRLARFSADGRQLLVTTADQIVRVIDATALGGPGDTVETSAGR